MKKLLFGNKNKLTRDKWVKKSLARIPRGKVILDAGAGERVYRKYCKHLKYVSQDFGKYDGLGDGLGLQTKRWGSGVDIVSDISNIPRNDASFDAILCTEVFEHLPNPCLAVEEFSRILKKGGTLILTAPFCSLTHFAPYHFYTGFNKYFYEKILPEYGFKIIETKTNGNYFEYIRQEILRLSFMVKNYSLLPYFILLPFCWLVELPILGLLSLMSRYNNNSESLLCFGYHIKAVKVK